MAQKSEKMKHVTVTAYPYAVQHGELDVPEGLSAEEEKEYINSHFEEIAFGAPDLDYNGTDFEWTE